MSAQKESTLFEELYEATYLPTARYLARHCAEADHIPDLLQETYLEVLRTIRQKGVDYIKEPLPFVLGVAKTRLFRYYNWRGKLRALFTPMEDFTDELTLMRADGPTTEESAETKAQLREIGALLKQQPPEVQRIFTLYYGCGLTTREIAAALPMKESTVRSKLHRTLLILRKQFRKEGTTL